MAAGKLGRKPDFSEDAGPVNFGYLVLPAGTSSGNSIVS